MEIDTIVSLVERIGLPAVIIAAAYTAVDRAESEEAQVAIVNATTPGAIAQACAKRGLPVVYVSTDYVFDGSGTDPWQPGDLPGPLGAYGRTKLAGEEAVRAAGGDVIAEAALVDRSAGSVDLGVPFYPLVAINFPTYAEDELPPELAATPAMKPGSRAN